MNYIRFFDEITLSDIALVGGKNASLGQMSQELTSQGIRVPYGFALTSQAYWFLLDHAEIREKIVFLISSITHTSDYAEYTHASKQIQTLILSAELPEIIIQEITQAYKKLCEQYGADCSVAVRSSATAEDLPDASFAGQQDSFLEVIGIDQILLSVKKCIASLFNERALMYRQEKQFDHMSVAISVGIQKMVRSDIGSSGVMFTLDTETGFKDLIMITGAYGLGEALVQGTITPDEYQVHKPTCKMGYASIIKKQLAKDHKTFCLTDKEILDLARMAIVLEDHYSKLKGSWCPLDIEWAKDGIDGLLYIVQARPETVHSIKNFQQIQYKLLAKEHPQILVTGQSIGQKIASGSVRIIHSLDQIAQFNTGDILVTAMTNPDWLPLMKKASAIITEQGGRTCHAAIVSRELGMPALIGTGDATHILKNKQFVTVDCSQGSTGFVYDTKIDFEVISFDLENLPQSPVKLMLTLGNPDSAFNHAQLPTEGVGLARLEFIISSVLKVHPMAIISPEKVTDPTVKNYIEEAAYAYNQDPREFFISTLAQSIGTLAAAFYPRQVIVRFSDFKSNEYRNLLGGSFFEPEEENPMLGFRGASRYISPSYAAAFELECEAVKRVRNTMGLTNLACMVPFVRTVHEAQQTVALLEKFGLKRGENSLALIMMCEIPSNVLLLEEFSEYFDGFSIGSNDLTQLTLGVDRDSALLAHLFDERDPAVKKMLILALDAAQKVNKPIGICGQAPSDFPEIAQFLIERSINSISLNPDSVIPFLMRQK